MGFAAPPQRLNPKRDGSLRLDARYYQNLLSGGSCMRQPARPSFSSTNCKYHRLLCVLKILFSTIALKLTSARRLKPLKMAMLTEPLAVLGSPQHFLQTRERGPVPRLEIPWEQPTLTQKASTNTWHSTAHLYAVALLGWVVGCHAVVSPSCYLIRLNLIQPTMTYPAWAQWTTCALQCNAFISRFKTFQPPISCQHGSV